MIMADVFAVFGTLLTIGIALPGLLLTWHLVFPNTVKRAQYRLVQTPWRCFWLGSVFLIGYSIPVIIFFSLPFGPLKAIGGIALLLLVTVTSIGAAGLAVLMGERFQRLGGDVSPMAATIRGAIALELAAIFPFIGWFIFIPLTFIITLGAAIFALLGWEARPTQASTSTDAPTLLSQRLAMTK